VDGLDQVTQVCDTVETSSLDEMFIGAKGHIALAKAVRLVLEEMFCQKATIYVCIGGGNESAYSKVVKGCFIAAIGYVPSGIKKHLIDAKRDSYPADYLIDISEEDIDAALKATKKKFDFE